MSFASNIWNNTTNATNAVLGNSDVIANPLLVDPANGDLRVSAGSPALDMQYVPSGLIYDYRWNIGFDQGDHSAGSSLLALLGAG
jgi:hypothetical protein